MLNGYFSNMLSSHVPGTALGYLPRLAQLSRQFCKVTNKFILQMGKLTGPGLQSANDRVEIQPVSEDCVSLS